MENYKITQLMKNPNGMYIKITNEELDKFFSNGYAKILKERCEKQYTMFDFKQGILEANYLAKNDENRHTVDLMLFALAHIEKLEADVLSFKTTINEFEQRFDQKNEIKQNNLIQDKKEM